MRKKLLTVSVPVVLLLVAVAGLFIYVTAARVEGHYFDAEGVRIHYTVEGQGEPLILIHGLSVHADINWRRNGIIDALDDHFQVIAYDVRGHGLSDRPTEKSAYGQELVKDVGRLMDHLRIESAHFAGYSLGGFITLDFMTRHPERVRSAVLCASGWHDPASDVFLSWRKGGKPILRKSDDSSTSPEKSAEKEEPVSRMLMAGFDFIRPLRKRLAHLIADPKAVHIIRYGAPDMEGVIRDGLEQCEIPTLCIIGSEDGFLPYAEALEANKPATEVQVLQGANHLTAVLEPGLREGMLHFLLDHREDS